MRHKWLLLACVCVILVHASLASPNYWNNADGGSAVKTDYWSRSSTQSDRISNNDNSTSTSTDRSFFVRAMNRSPTTRRPSSICTGSTINYDCILQNVQLDHNEDQFYGLDWKNNIQKNITFTNSRLAYLPKSLFTAFPQMELLNAEDVQIEYIEDDAFIRASNLKQLFLQNNLISAIHTFRGVPLLTHLDLSHNRINQIQNDAFQNNKNLKVIFMNNNQIPELPGFHSLENLEFLNFSNNVLHQINDNQFIKTSKLEYLDLSFNQLQFLNLNQLDEHRDLFLVDVSYNNLESLYIPGHVRKLVARNNSIQDIISNDCIVEYIDLSYNRIMEISTLRKCAGIKILDLSYNKLQSFDLIGYLPVLNILNLAHNQLFEIDFPTKIPHPLQILDLSHNLLSYGPANKFSNLKIVKLNNNKFIEFKFANLNKLTYMQLSKNEWKCENIQQVMTKKQDVVVDANETCINSNSRIQNGICCRDYKRAFNDRLNELLREINLHDNVNKIDLEQCKQIKLTNGASTPDIQTLHENAAKLDAATKQILKQIEMERLKTEEVSREINYGNNQQLSLQTDNQNFKQIIEKLRDHYGIPKEGLVGAYETLNRTVQHTQERNILSINLSKRRMQEKEDTNDRLEKLKTDKNTLNDENTYLKNLLADFKQREVALKKERQKLERDANKNSPSLQGSG